MLNKNNKKNKREIIIKKITQGQTIKMDKNNKLNISQNIIKVAYEL